MTETKDVIVVLNLCVKGLATVIIEDDKRIIEFQSKFREHIVYFFILKCVEVQISVCDGEGFPNYYHQEMLQTPGGCPTIQFNSDSTYLEIASTGSTGEGISPTRLPPMASPVSDTSQKPRLLPVLLTNCL